MDRGNTDGGSQCVTWSTIMSALQITKPAHEIESVDVRGKSLRDINEWSNFYAAYSRLKGFSVRNGKIRRNKAHDVCQRTWVCSREGYREKKWIELSDRKRTAKAVTRIGCKASLTVSYRKELRNWVATAFIHEHNHDLASPSELQFLRSHRLVPESMVSQAKSMKMAGIRTISILDYISMQCGGRANLPFTKKDFYNKLAGNRLATGKETDSEGALGYLTCLAIRDGNFFCRFNVDDDERLHTIFWSDGTSRADYKVFGDVMAFDTTYRTNAYNKPLMIMVGVNHHFRTTVFGVALLADETADTYTWVLTQFVECMGGQQPKMVVTDGDHAMRAAITQVLTKANHRLCAWHMDANASSNVPNGEFKIQFRKLMYKFYSKGEFEEKWRQMVEENNLQQHPWITSAYEKKQSWAESYLRGNFIAGMRTTQRCESMNAYMRRFLESKQLLRDFVSQIDQGIQHIRLTELEDDFKTKHSAPLIPSKDQLAVHYSQFASACTQNIYHMIAKEIEAHNSYTISSSDYTRDSHIFHLSKFRVGEITHEVTYAANCNKISCQCLLLETDGIPCRHIFTVLKHLNIVRIPDSLIIPRWRKDAKSAIQLYNAPTSTSTDVMQSGRFGILAAEFNTLATYASKYEDTFQEARRHFATLTETFRMVSTLRQGEHTENNQNFDEKVAGTTNVIRDPTMVRTKGREKEANKVRHDMGVPKEAQRKRCRLCNQSGHNKATCKQRNIRPSPIRDDQGNQHQQNHISSFSEATDSQRDIDDNSWINEILTTYTPDTTQQDHDTFLSKDNDRLWHQSEQERIPVETDNPAQNQTTKVLDEHWDWN